MPKNVVVVVMGTVLKCITSNTLKRLCNDGIAKSMWQKVTPVTVTKLVHCLPVDNDLILKHKL